MPRISNGNLPKYSKDYHIRIEGDRDLAEPTSSVLKREHGIECNHEFALKPGQSGVRLSPSTWYYG